MQIEIQSHAVLDAIGTENYIRYGAEGPRRFVMGGAVDRLPSPKQLEAQLWVLPHAASEPETVFDPIIFSRVEHTPGRLTAWSGTLSTERLSIIWGWDFFRISSHLHLRLIASNPPSADFLKLQGLRVGDHLILRAHSPNGTIEQKHPLTSPVQKS